MHETLYHDQHGQWQTCFAYVMFVVHNSAELISCELHLQVSRIFLNSDHTKQTKGCFTLNSGCRHWKPVSISCAYYHCCFMVKVAMLLNSCTYQLCLICRAVTNIVNPLNGWMAFHVGVELKQHWLSLRNLLGLRPRQLRQKIMRWKPVQW